MPSGSLRQRAIVRSAAIITAGAAYESGAINLSSIILNDPQSDYIGIQGFVNASGNGQLQLYWGYQLADLAALPVGVGIAVQQNFNLVGGAVTGLVFTSPVYAPWLRVRHLNNSGLDYTTFRLHVFAVE